MLRGPTLVIRERDVGFFSLYLQVINTLICVDKQRFQCSVYVDLGSKQSYYCGANSWLDFFEPILDQTHAVSELQLRKVDRDFNKRIREMLYWDAYGSIYKKDDSLFWTGSYYPQFNHESAAFHIGHMDVPNARERETAARIISKCIRPNKKTQNELDQFVARSLKDHFVIGVQFRGSDARVDDKRRIPTYADFIRRIDVCVTVDNQEFVGCVIRLGTGDTACADGASGCFEKTPTCLILLSRHDWPFRFSRWR